MANFEIDEEVLVAFLKGELDAAQAAAVEAWYDRSAANRRMLGQVYYILYVSDRINDAAGIDVERSLRQFKRRMHAGRRISLRRIAVRAAAAAAVAVILLAGGVTTVSLSKRLAQPLTVITHLGERSQVVLPDGTKVWLNAGTRLEYPLVFAGGERRVKVAGEAMFDVEHDPAHPFVVETFACDVRVLGTKFNVEANEEEGIFTADLLRGRVQVCNRTDRSDRITMEPNQTVHLENGKLQLHAQENADKLLWTDGILCITGMTFEEVMAKFERCYDINVEILRDDLPQIEFQRCKLRISEGIDHALAVLQHAADFRYERDITTNTLYIR